MSSSRWMIGVALACAPAALLVAGCAHRHCHGGTHMAEASKPERTIEYVAELLPPDAKPGECYVKVFVPEKFETTKETVCVREASERLEIVPAQYEWVEEKILVKDASTILEEVPAEFKWEAQTIQTNPGHSGWHVEKTASLAADRQEASSSEMFCLVEHQPQFETLKTQVLAKPVTTRAAPVPAEYQTIRRQKLVAPATTRRIPIPAEYATVDKMRKVADSRVEWQRVDCQIEGRPENVTVIKETLARSGN